jgi:osmotically-inducible protein OsmY
MPPIHIIVENGRATLKGVVATKSDSQLAYTAAREVPGLFEVRNELRIEN